MKIAWALKADMLSLLSRIDSRFAFDCYLSGIRAIILTPFSFLPWKNKKIAAMEIYSMRIIYSKYF